MHLKALSSIAAAVAAVFLLVPCSTAPVHAETQIAQGKRDLNFGSGRQGGSQYPVTVAIGQVLEKLPEIGRVSLQPGGSVGNIIRVETGKSDIAISMSTSLRGGRLGSKPFKKKTPNVVNLMTLHAFHVVAIVPADSPIKSIKDMAGKRINVAPKGYSILVIANQVMDMTGIKGKVKVGHLRITDAIQNFKDGHFDGLFYAASQRMAPFLNLAQTRDIRLVAIDRPILEAFVKKEPSFYIAEWPQNRSIYKKLANSVTTMAYPNVIVTNTKLPEATAYAIVKAVAENFDEVRVGDRSLNEFDPKDMARSVGSPFHPGAIKYYRERGWVK